MKSDVFIIYDDEERKYYLALKRQFDQLAISVWKPTPGARFFNAAQQLEMREEGIRNSKFVLVLLPSGGKSGARKDTPETFAAFAETTLRLHGTERTLCYLITNGDRDFGTFPENLTTDLSGFFRLDAKLETRSHAAEDQGFADLLNKMMYPLDRRCLTQLARSVALLNEGRRLREANIFDGLDYGLLANEWLALPASKGDPAYFDVKQELESYRSLKPGDNLDTESDADEKPSVWPPAPFSYAGIAVFGLAIVGLAATNYDWALQKPGPASTRKTEIVIPGDPIKDGTTGSENTNNKNPAETQASVHKKIKPKAIRLPPSSTVALQPPQEPPDPKFLSFDRTSAQ